MTLFRNMKREYMAFLKGLVKVLGAFGLGTILLSCGTSPGYNYTVSGTVSAMIGSGLVLQNNGGDDLSISANGAFSFKTTLTNGAAYSVKVATNPSNPSQVCTVSNSSGTINSGPVTNIVVNCSMNSTAVTIDPTDAFVYVSLYSYTSNNVSAYTIDKTTVKGALTNPKTATAGTNPNTVTVYKDSSSGNEYAYVSNVTSGNVSAFSINPTTGALTLVPDTNNPYTAGTYPNPVTVATVNSKQYAYVSNMGSNDIYVYAIDSSSGSLGANAIQTISTGTSPTTVTVDSTGKFAYVANVTSGTVSIYTIVNDGTSDNGTLTSSGTFTAGTYPVSIAVIAGSSTQFLYVANMGSNNISVYTMDSSGTWTQGTTMSAGTYPMSVAIDSTNSFAYVSNVGSTNISIYSISGGALSYVCGDSTGSTVGCPSTGTYPNPVTIATVGSDQFAYVSNKGSNDIYVYSIGTGGGLTVLPTIGSGTLPNPVRVDSSGQYAYVSSSGDGKIYAYTIDQTATSTRGELTLVGAY